MIQLISFWSNFHDFLNQNLPNQVVPCELGLFIVSKNKNKQLTPQNSDTSSPASTLAPEV